MKINSIFIHNTKVTFGRFGVRIYTKNYLESRRILKYLVNEGLMNRYNKNYAT